MINWPDSLIDELAARRCVIFIGSGTSASATKKGLIMRQSALQPGIDYLKSFWKNVMKIKMVLKKKRMSFFKIKNILIVLN